ncbi:hypothetical protein QFC21_000735 [Naganishia friedmannii]|uniref:Uncharacterized protein n=1 Tax=Naganishia friedmannii TaxID=89922 RepID=A0ACC2W6D1_9TREE|nr:hypothetical protein QFC21_000735 [Naganishia friedmannii]
MSRNHPPTPLHLFRRGSSPANVSLTPLVINHKGAAAAVAGLGMGMGMGLGTAAVGAGVKSDLTMSGTGVWSRPFMHLAATATAGSSSTSVANISTTITALPTLRNRLPISSPSTATISLHHHHRQRAVPPSSLTPSGTQVFLGYGYGAGYEQHQTGLSLPAFPVAGEAVHAPDPTYSTAAANIFGSLIRGPPPPFTVDTPAPVPVKARTQAKNRHHRVWSLRPTGDERRRLERKRTESVVGGEASGSESVNREQGSGVLVPPTNGYRSSITSKHPSTVLAQATPLPAAPTSQNPAPAPPPPPETKKSPSSPTPPTHAAKPRFTLHSSASGIPKQRHQTPPPPRSGTNTSDPLSKTTAVQVGEDAYFLRDDSLGISDGVGGWSSARRKRQQRRIKFDTDGEDGTPGRRGGEEWVEAEGDADPGRFSRLLMHFCEREVDAWRARAAAAAAAAAGKDVSVTKGPDRRQQGRGEAASDSDGSVGVNAASDSTLAEKESSTGSESRGEGAYGNPSGKESVVDVVMKPLDPVEVMQKGYEKCLECVQSEGIFGSATCLVATLTENTLRVANLGDCAIVVVRKGEIVFRTEEMQHSFNFPLQLGTNSRDEPMKDAEYFEVRVEEGDIVVMCSDGLSDNLFDEDILDIIASHPSPPQPSTLADALCKAAQEASEETGSASPFMCRAIEEGLDFMGGKKDDISVLVAVVRDGEEGV